MQAFSDIRDRARERRDRIISHARTEYAATLRRIAALEQDLLGRDSSTHLKISEAIERCIPGDRTFNTQDIMAALETMDPSRVWRKRSVDGHIFRLREMESKLRARHPELNGELKTRSISNALRTLEATGRLKEAVKGKGRRPTTYSKTPSIMLEKDGCEFRFE